MALPLVAIKVINPLGTVEYQIRSQTGGGASTHLHFLGLGDLTLAPRSLHIKAGSIRLCSYYIGQPLVQFKCNLFDFLTTDDLELGGGMIRVD